MERDRRGIQPDSTTWYDVGQGDLRDIKDTQREHTRRLGHIELNTAQQNVADAEQSTRIDRLAERVARTETRLESRG